MVVTHNLVTSCRESGEVGGLDLYLPRGNMQSITSADYDLFKQLRCSLMFDHPLQKKTSTS